MPGNEAKSECHSVLEDSLLTQKCCTVMMYCVHSKTIHSWISYICNVYLHNPWLKRLHATYNKCTMWTSALSLMLPNYLKNVNMILNILTFLSQLSKLKVASSAFMLVFCLWFRQNSSSVSSPNRYFCELFLTSSKIWFVRMWACTCVLHSADTEPAGWDQRFTLAQSWQV